jgi:FMN phosphatase YigB (HAD superfamily)
MPPRILQIMRAEPGLAWMSEFSVALFSCDVGMVKPEPGFYRLCLERLDARPEECVFFDDSEVNVRSGAALGIASYVFRSAEEAARQISAISADIPVRALREKEAC